MSWYWWRKRDWYRHLPPRFWPAPAQDAGSQVLQWLMFMSLLPDLQMKPWERESCCGIEGGEFCSHYAEIREFCGGNVQNIPHGLSLLIDCDTEYSFSWVVFTLSFFGYCCQNKSLHPEYENRTFCWEASAGAVGTLQLRQCVGGVCVYAHTPSPRSCLSLLSQQCQGDIPPFLLSWLSCLWKSVLI